MSERLDKWSLLFILFQSRRLQGWFEIAVQLWEVRTPFSWRKWMERSAKRGERIGGHNVVAMRLERESAVAGRLRFGGAQVT